MSDDPVHGVDYLIDYYAILDVERFATQQQLKDAYRKGQMLYHPDRYQGLAPDFQKQAERKSQLLTEAYDLLQNEDSRYEYDQKLASWTKPISRNGNPIIPIDGSGFSFSALARRVGQDAAEADVEAEKLALTFSGFEKATYEFFKNQADSEAGIPVALMPAYIEQLKRRELYLSLRKGFIWGNIGMKNHSPAPELYLTDQTERDLALVRENVRMNLDEQFQLLAQGKKALLAPPAGVDMATEGDRIKKQYDSAIQEHIAKQEEQLRPLVEEHEELINKRFLLEAQIAYHPFSTIITKFLIVEIRLPDGNKLFAFELVSDTNVQSIEDTEIRATWETDGAEAWIRKGFSVVSFTPVGEIEFRSQLEQVVSLHYDKLLKDSRSS